MYDAHTSDFLLALYSLLYGIFLIIQTGRHQGFFVEPHDDVAPAAPTRSLYESRDSSAGALGRHTLLLLITMLPIVLLAKQLAKSIDYGIAVLGRLQHWAVFSSPSSSLRPKGSTLRAGAQ